MSSPAAGAPLPRDVPGYAQAKANGVVTEVPPTPPRLRSGTSARERFNLWLVQLVAVFALSVPVVKLAPRTPLPDPAVTPVLGLVLLVALLWLLWGWRQVGKVNAEELKEGYTTLVLTYGAFRPSAPRRWPTTGHRAPWDYRGVWVLRPRTGQVVSVPTAGLDPPGFFPSPHREGWLELWTGCVWAGEYSRAQS